MDEYIPPKPPTNLKAKLHPFDFTQDDFISLKPLFPEFKPRRSTKKSSSKIVGLPIEVTFHLTQIGTLLIYERTYKS